MATDNAYERHGEDPKKANAGDSPEREKLVKDQEKALKDQAQQEKEKEERFNEAAKKFKAQQEKHEKQAERAGEPVPASPPVQG